MADPQSKVNMDPTFEQRFRDLKTHAKEIGDALIQTNQRKWFRPGDWLGDPFDIEGMSAVFDRSEVNQQLVQAIANQEAPGTTGDVVAASVMINELAVMERAFRARHTLRRARGQAHAIGRLQGHGDDKGPLIQLATEYVRALIRQAKKPQ